MILLGMKSAPNGARDEQTSQGAEKPQAAERSGAGHFVLSLSKGTAVWFSISIEGTNYGSDFTTDGR